MLPRVVPGALAGWLSLPALQRTPPFALSPRRSGVLPVPGLPAPDHAAQRHRVRGHQTAAAHVDVGDPPADRDQDQHGSAGADAPSGRELQGGVADQAQAHAGHMAERESTRKLGGFVQIDDAYLGGERNGGKVGRGAPGKQAFVAAVETDEDLEHPRYAVLEPVRTFDNASLTDWCQRRLAPEAELYSDGLACFARCIDTGNAHTVLVTEGRRASCEVVGARWVNVVLANVKRAISGRYHAFKQSKYARRYLAEAQYRFNRRFRLAEMLPRLMRAMMLCSPWPEPNLRVSGNFHG